MRSCESTYLCAQSFNRQDFARGVHPAARLRRSSPANRHLKCSEIKNPSGGGLVNRKLDIGGAINIEQGLKPGSFLRHLWRG
jgi:hypothetical protein